MDATTVVVTGGSRWIGRAVAEAFAEEGASVVLGAREVDELEATVESLESADGPVTSLRTDVRDEFDVERLMETASRFGNGGGIDVLIAAAGVYHGDSGETPLDRESYGAFDDHWRTNARGVFTTITEALPHLNDEARVLVPTDAVARDAEPGYGSYAASKAGAEAVVRGFAVDTPFTVACLDPGDVASDLSSDGERDPAAVAPLFRWAATDADAEDLDGSVLGLQEWKRATQ